MALSQNCPKSARLRADQMVVFVSAGKCVTKSQNKDLYSRAYVERGDPTSDSKKARVRLGAYLDRVKGGAAYFKDYFKMEGGYSVPTHLSNSLEKHFVNAPLLEVLDLISLAYQCLRSGEEFERRRYGAPSFVSYTADKDYVKFVRNVLVEENLSYSIDNDGFVHPLVDKEFADSGASLLRGLAKEPAIKKEIEHCYSELAKIVPRYKTAVRAIFEAVEILTKRMAKTDKLDSAIVRKELTKIVVDKLSTNATSKNAYVKIMIGFASWVDGVHFYWHGQSDEDHPIDIPEELAITLVSTGASFLRLLLDASRT